MLATILECSECDHLAIDSIFRSFISTNDNQNLISLASLSGCTRNRAASLLPPSEARLLAKMRDLRI